jgi:resuscitation-promoting factor RpfB
MSSLRRHLARSLWLASASAFAALLFASATGVAAYALTTDAGPAASVTDNPANKPATALVATAAEQRTPASTHNGPDVTGVQVAPPQAEAADAQQLLIQSSVEAENARIQPELDAVAIPLSTEPQTPPVPVRGTQSPTPVAAIATTPGIVTIPQPGGTIFDIVAAAFPEDPYTAYRVVICESSGNPGMNSGNGYYGMWQFDAATWSAMGGTGVASEASAEEQTARARLLYDRRGWQPWGCA